MPEVSKAMTGDSRMEEEQAQGLGSGICDVQAQKEEQNSESAASGGTRLS